jgi:predicted PurR-regulated permease PerM
LTERDSGAAEDPHQGTRTDDPTQAAAAAEAAADDAAAARRSAGEARDEAREASDQLDEVSDRFQRGDGRPSREPDEDAFGRPGRPIRRDSPFMLGFLGALGVFLAYFLIQAVVQARSVIILIVVSLFLAIGLSPLVEGMTRRGMRRPVAILIVFLVVIGGFVAFGFAVIPPVAEQSDEFVQSVPQLLQDLRGNPTIRRFDDDYDVIQKAQDYVTSGNLGQQLFGGIVGVGRIVVNAVFGAFSVLILTLYFLAALPSMKRQAYRLVPASRRERVQLLSDEVIARIGGYVSGAFVVALIAAVTSYVFLRIIDLPYALALAVFVGILDLVPLVGATIAAVGITVLGFLESPLIGLACLIFYVAYQQFENYVIYPRVMRRAVDVPAAVTVVAVLLGGALLGIVGALLAIPTAAAILLVVRQVAIPRMDEV